MKKVIIASTLRQKHESDYQDSKRRYESLNPSTREEKLQKYVWTYYTQDWWLKQGMSDSKANKIIDKIMSFGYSLNEVFEEIDRQCDEILPIT